MPIIQTNTGYGYVYRKGDKKQKKLSPFLKFIFTIFIIAVLLVGGIYLARIIPNYIGIKTNYYFNKTNIYTINCGSFDDYETALILAETVKKQGGAGYVFFNNKKYNVLLSGYAKKDECLSVIDNLSQNGVEATMLCIELKEMSANFSATSDEKVKIKNAINTFFDCYQSLYSLSIEFDKDVLTKSEVLDEINKLSNKVTIQKNAFTTKTDTNTNASLVYLKIYLDKLSDYLKTLSSCKENFSAEIKNTYFQSLMCYYDFRQEIS